MAEKENDKAELKRYRAKRKAEWLAELDHSLDRLHNSAKWAITRLRIIYSLTQELQESGLKEFDPGFPDFRDFKIQETLGIVGDLAAKTIHEIDQDKSDVIDKLMIDLQDERQIQKKTPSMATKAD